MNQLYYGNNLHVLRAWIAAESSIKLYSMSELPTTKPRTFYFVLMPFDEKFDDVYQIGIKESCREAGAYCERVDEQIFHERILDRIYNQIAKADCIIAVKKIHPLKSLNQVN